LKRSPVEIVKMGEVLGSGVFDSEL